MDVREAKDIVILMVLRQTDVPKDDETINSIKNAVYEGRFYAVGMEEKLLKFLTWQEDHIDNGLYIFVNNLWVNKDFRNKNALLEIRKILRFIYPSAVKFYWHNRRRDILRYRR